MNLETFFSVAGTIALPGWLLLILVPWWRWGTQLIAPFVIPLILALMYGYLIVTNLGRAEGDFNSLAGMRGLFEVDALLLAGWIHYLAFDLFVGSWEVSRFASSRHPASGDRAVPDWHVPAGTDRAGPVLCDSRRDAANGVDRRWRNRPGTPLKQG